jgi:hypothetical protein
MVALILLLLSTPTLWPDSVVSINLEFNPEQWAYACENPDEEILVDAVISTGDWWSGCTMQIRGQTSRYYPKKSIKVRLDSGGTLFGFRELNLNAQYSDRSRIRENLSYLFHAHCGQIVPFAAMTEVRFNGATQGPYLFVEDVDSEFAHRTWLPEDAVVYKCRDYGSSLNSPANLHKYVKKTFKNLPMHDLEWFIRWLVTSPDSVFLSDISQRVHLEALTTCIAVNTLIGHGSTYYHNYHMVLDAPGLFGRWRMIPWDMDKTWSVGYGPDLPHYWATNNISDPNTLIWRLWCHPHTRGILLAKLNSLNGIFHGWASSGVVDSLALLAAPLVEVDPYRNYTMDQFYESIQVIRDWPALRADNLSQMIMNWPLPFRLYSTAFTEGGILATWSDAGRSSRYRVLLSTDSTFLDESATYWEFVTTDTCITIPHPGHSILESAYLQVRAFNNFRDERALNRSVSLAPPPGVSRTGNVIINEVFYRNGQYVRPGDWVELFNAGGNPVHLGGWAFRDTPDRNLHVIGDIILAPGEFIVLRQDPIAFFNTYPDCPVDPRPISFGLSSDGETLRLYNHLGMQADYVPYLPVSPWPEEPADGGWSLALISPERDGSKPSSWFAIPDGGTPGLPNNSAPPWAPGFDLTIERLFPNPVEHYVSVELNTKPGGECVFRVFDMAGRVVAGPVHTSLPVGQHSLALDVSRLPAGAYFFQISYAGLSRAARFIKLESSP